MQIAGILDPSARVLQEKEWCKPLCLRQFRISTLVFWVQSMLEGEKYLDFILQRFLSIKSFGTHKDL